MPDESHSYQIELKEGSWQSIDTNRQKASALATREDFLRVLSNIEDFSIRATFHPYMQQTIISDIRLDTAVPQNTGLSLALEVEQCVCPPGYVGLSCEECAPGYIRDTSTPGYGRCTRCNCNSHSETCDPNTGFCVVSVGAPESSVTFVRNTFPRNSLLRNLLLPKIIPTYFPKFHFYVNYFPEIHLPKIHLAETHFLEINFYVTKFPEIHFNEIYFPEIYLPEVHLP